MLITETSAWAFSVGEGLICCSNPNQKERKKLPEPVEKRLKRPPPKKREK